MEWSLPPPRRATTTADQPAAPPTQQRRNRMGARRAGRLRCQTVLATIRCRSQRVMECSANKAALIRYLSLPSSSWNVQALEQYRLPPRRHRLAPSCTVLQEISETPRAGSPGTLAPASDFRGLEEALRRTPQHLVTALSPAPGRTMPPPSTCPLPRADSSTLAREARTSIRRQAPRAGPETMASTVGASRGPR